VCVCVCVCTFTKLYLLSGAHARLEGHITLVRVLLVALYRQKFSKVTALVNFCCKVTNSGLSEKILVFPCCKSIYTDVSAVNHYTLTTQNFYLGRRSET